MRSLTVALTLLQTGALSAGLPDGYQKLILLPEASPEVRQATEHMANLMERQFGERPRITRISLWDTARGIRIGPEPEHPSFDNDPLTDEIVIEQDPRGLRILGSDNPSTIRAIGRFAEAVLGWRAYQPGSIGMELLDTRPALPESEGPLVLYEKASYLSRNPSMDNTPESEKWERWHGLRERLHYNHSLHHVLPASVFDTNPNWFAKDDNGNPMRPPYYPQAHGHNDHPDLSNLELRSAVAESALLSLQEKLPLRLKAQVDLQPGMQPHRLRLSPGLVSLSLSLGDAYVFGEFPEDYPYHPDHHFRRWPDWSNHVFDYSNAVAETIANTWNKAQWLSSGDKPVLLIGVLSYLLWEDVPDFPLHPSIIPVLTYDRSQWHDPNGRLDDLGNVEAWNQTNAPFLATWDYLFGYGFLIPRSLSTVVSESLPELHERGVLAYFSQVCPIWPYDGHTNWLTAQLLWNVDADPRALLDEFFLEYYGPAAEHIRNFMEHAESLWMNQEGEAWWLRYWKDPWQAGLWSESDLMAMEDRLTAAQHALEKASHYGVLNPERFHQRLNRLRETFELTKAFLRYQWAAWDFQLQSFADLSKSEWNAALQAAQDLLELRRALIKTRDKVISTIPGTSYIADLSWVFRYDSTGGSIVQLASQNLSAEETAAVQAVYDDWAELAGVQAGTVAGAPSSSVLYDRSFSHLDDPKIWRFEFMEAEGLDVGPHPILANTLQIRNARRGHLYQLFKAEPGDLYLGRLEVSSNQTSAGDLSLILEFFDSEMRLLSTSPRGRMAPPDIAGMTQVLRTVSTAPQNAAFGRIKIRCYELEPDRPVLARSPDVRRVSP